MADFVNRFEAFTYAVSVCSDFAKNADDCRMSLRSDPPDVQVCNSGIPWLLNQFADFLGDMHVCLIQQHACGHPH